MEIIISLIGFLLGVISLFLLILKFNNLYIQLIFGFFLRFLAAFYHCFIGYLPDNIDPLKYERLAWNFGQNGIFKAIEDFGVRGPSYIYMHIISIIYSVIGRSPFFIQMIHVIFGLFNIILTYRLSFLIWRNRNIALTASWIISLFPTAIMYSALTNREVFISFFVLLSAIQTIKWLKYGRTINFIFAIFFFLPHYFLHGPLILGAVFLFFTFILNNINNGIKALQNSRLNFLFIISVLILIFLGFGFTIIISNFSIPYIGSNLNNFNYSLIFNRAIYLNTGGAAYPQWLMPSELIDLFVLTVPRLIYFFFSPFPWDIRTLNQLLGLIDSFLYMYLFYNIIKIVKIDHKLLNLSSFFVNLILIFVIYCWGVSNYGTGLRHRAKFVPVLIAIAISKTPKNNYKTKTCI